MIKSQLLYQLSYRGNQLLIQQSRAELFTRTRVPVQANSSFFDAANYLEKNVTEEEERWLQGCNYFTLFVWMATDGDGINPLKPV